MRLSPQKKKHAFIHVSEGMHIQVFVLLVLRAWYQMPVMQDIVQLFAQLSIN